MVYQSAELGELTSARSEEDETNLLHSDLSHAELARSSILETVGDDGAAAAAAADVECETDEGLELMLDQGTCVYVWLVTVSLYVS